MDGESLSGADDLVRSLAASDASAWSVVAEHVLRDGLPLLLTGVVGADAVAGWAEQVRRCPQPPSKRLRRQSGRRACSAALTPSS